MYRSCQKYRNNKLKTDPFFKFKATISGLIRNSFKRNSNTGKKNKRTEEILGCTIEEFKTYIENKFTTEMNWDNHGTYWHLDHKKPIALATNEEEVYVLNHHTNFQPLYWEDNLAKGCKY